MASQKPKCLICGNRPRYGDIPYCKQCGDHIASESKPKNGQEAFRYLVYRGAVIGFYFNGDEQLKPVLLKRDPQYLPKSKTINLDTYCEGFTRQQVKKLKRTARKLGAFA